MINLKDMDFYESGFTKIVTQGEIGECQDFGNGRSLEK